MRPSDTVLFAAVAAHYIQDAHMPLHASNNHDGQLTGQTGVHTRFETALFERYRSRLTVIPHVVTPIADARGAAFDTLLASHQLVARLLQADKTAAAGKKVYDDAYYDRFFATARPLLEQRLAASIAVTAAIVSRRLGSCGKTGDKIESVLKSIASPKFLRFFLVVVAVFALRVPPAFAQAASRDGAGHDSVPPTVRHASLRGGSGQQRSALLVGHGFRR